ncbi:Hypothetical protein FKW44_012719 [Caligus rogercresseyi]|uniref:Uncharacterized protein n=1 Tax=Caligus rogercresseyi TaxID=217165 RepID=A0A7T8HKC7_CALRO|nr:Hypothetical protein FKW44_012719 [Caligus rogercresseyi]
MNASKTQLLIGGSDKASEVKTFTIPIYRVDVRSSRTIELLGVTLTQLSPPVPMRPMWCGQQNSVRR